MGVEDIIATCGRWLNTCKPALAGAAAAIGFYAFGSAIIDATQMQEIVSPFQLLLGNAILSASVGTITYAASEVAAHAHLFQYARQYSRPRTSSQTPKKTIRSRLKHLVTHYPASLTLGALAMTQYAPLRQTIVHGTESGLTLDDTRFLARFASQAIGGTIFLQALLPFLDPVTRKAQWYGTLSSWRRDRGQHETAIALAKRSCDVLDSRLSRLALGDCYAARNKQGDLERAMREMNRAFVHERREDPLLEYAEQNRLRWLLERWRSVRDYRRFSRTGEAVIDDGLKLALLHFGWGDQPEAIATLGRLSERHPGNRDLRLLHAISLGEVGRTSEARAQLAGVFRNLLQEERQSFRALEESAHAVLEYVASEFIADVVVFKRGKRPEVMAEVAMISHLERVIENHQMYRVPHVLVVIDDAEDRDGICCIMKRAHGQHLEDVAEDAAGQEAYRHAAAFTAYLHANLPETMSAFGRRPIIGRTEASLHNAYFLPDVSEDAARDILTNYRPVHDAVATMPYAANVDAHPRNFILPPDGTLIKIDHEDRGASPICFDVANVMRGRMDMEPIIDAYWRNHCWYTNHPMVEAAWEQFRLGCLNSAYHRAIAFASAWSLPHLADKRSKRQAVLAWGSHAIGEIERLHPAYFEQHRREYAVLRRSFDTIIRRLGGGA